MDFSTSCLGATRESRVAAVAAQAGVRLAACAAAGAAAAAKASAATASPEKAAVAAAEAGSTAAKCGGPKRPVGTGLERLACLKNDEFCAFLLLCFSLGLAHNQEEQSVQVSHDQNPGNWR